MTEQPDESLDPKPADNDAGSQNIEQPASNELQNPVSSNVDDTANPDEGLPEWEPLTPELVEDEAIRGDFVIKWVVVGLSLLLGVSQIAETRTLLHLKNGMYLLQHGILPGANDVFSYTASDRKWINLSWMFDIVMSVVHAIGGGIGLSMIQGLIAGAIFTLLVHSVRPNIRTWWGSICAVLALLSCYPQFTIQTELITMLGVSFLLWTLVTAEETGRPKRLWTLVPVLWFWAQCDQRAWIGLLILILWTVGDWLSSEKPTSEKALIGKITVISLFAVAIHPFLWESWLAPVRMYTIDYPAMRFAYQQPTAADQGFYPLWDRVHWQSINHRTIASLFLFAATIVTFVLNRSHARWSHLLAMLGINGLSVIGTHEIAVASLVNCVVCTWNAQVWYRERFGQMYSIDWRELLFSRGGRAVTVISFFALAWVILSGRLEGPNGKRTGIGFETHLANAMDDYRNLGASLIDDRPFHFSIRQGDLMIWGGQKTFVDSRAGLFFGSAESNLLDLHNKTRMAFRQSADEHGHPLYWKPTFSKYQIQQALPRLNGPVPAPDYVSFFGLLSSNEFQLTSINGSTAVFIRVNDSTAEFRNQHPFDLSQVAFHEQKEPKDEQPRDYSKPVTTYDNLFSIRRHAVPAEVQLGQHYLRFASADSLRSMPTRFAAALLAIRHTNVGLRVDSNSADGYRILGISYYLLGQFEMDLMRQNGMSLPNRLRYYQAIAALQQAAALQPDDPMITRQLLQQYETTGRSDVQLSLIRQLKAQQPFPKSLTEEQKNTQDRMNEAITVLQETVDKIDAMVSDQLSKGADRLQVATGALQAGGLLKAIRVLEEDAIYLAKSPLAKIALGNWLLEIGRVREATEIFESIESMSAELPFVSWRDSAAIAALATANYDRAITLWTDQVQMAVDVQTESALQTLPFVTLNPKWAGPDSYPSSTVNSAAQLLQAVRLEGSTLHFQIAMAQLEKGANEQAIKSIRRALELNPATVLRPLLAFYLQCLAGEQIELKAPDVDVEEIPDLADANGGQSAEVQDPVPTKPGAPVK